MFLVPLWGHCFNMNTCVDLQFKNTLSPKHITTKILQLDNTTRVTGQLCKIIELITRVNRKGILFQQAVIFFIMKIKSETIKKKKSRIKEFDRITINPLGCYQAKKNAPY